MPTHERAIAELRRINGELRGLRQKFLFSQRRSLGQAIVAIDEVTGDRPPVRDVPADQRCSCGRAELTLPDECTGGLRYESQGVNAVGARCPYCEDTVRDVQNRREGEPDDS